MNERDTQQGRTQAVAVTVPMAVDITPLAMLERAVISGADVAVLERLMALSERWQANQAQRAFAEALSAARGDLPAILKTKTVDFSTSKGRTHYQYEDLADVIEQVAPALTQHGLSFRWRTDSETAGYVKVTCILSHRAGYSEETALSGPYDVSGNKNPIQAIGSVVTYLQRYTLKAALGIAAGVDDDGRQGAPTRGQEQPRQAPQAPKPDQPIGPEMALRFLEHADKQGWPRPHLLNAAKKYYGVTDLAALTTDQAGWLKEHMRQQHAQAEKDAQGAPQTGDGSGHGPEADSTASVTDGAQDTESSTGQEAAGREDDAEADTRAGKADPGARRPPGRTPNQYVSAGEIAGLTRFASQFQMDAALLLSVAGEVCGVTALEELRKDQLKAVRERVQAHKP